MTDVVTVDRKALKELLEAVSGPPHLIRELQAIRPLGDSPIDKLVVSYNEHAMSGREGIPLYECTNCGCLYQTKVTRCDCMPDKQEFRNWTAYLNEKWQLEELLPKKRDLLRRITMELESYAPEFIFDVEILLQEVREIFEKELNHD